MGLSFASMEVRQLDLPKPELGLEISADLERGRRGPHERFRNWIYPSTIEWSSPGSGSSRPMRSRFLNSLRPSGMAARGFGLFLNWPPRDFVVWWAGLRKFPRRN